MPPKNTLPQNTLNAVSEKIDAPDVSADAVFDRALFHYLPRNPTEFFSELDELTKQVYADRRPEDVSHLKRMDRWGKAFSIVGYATSWMGLNPISVIGIAMGISWRWMMAHHVLHRGYDGYEGLEDSKKSQSFARGMRRWIDWCDWLPPKAWIHEHNQMHHYRLGEKFDADIPEANFEWLVKTPFPRAIKYVVTFLASLTWKWTYYGPRITQVSMQRRDIPPGPYAPWTGATWNPFHSVGRRVWFESWLPHFLIRFGLIPLLFLPLGRTAWIAVLLNSLFAELLTNLQSFLLVVNNHAGSDIPRFDTRPKNRNEFRLRQIVGSVNFKTGGDWNDFFHGWLNYQIEHHVWSDLSLRQYQTWQPHLKELCERHGVPYIQESVWKRTGKLITNVMGSSKMPVLNTLPTPA